MKAGVGGKTRIVPARADNRALGGPTFLIGNLKS